MKKNSLYQRENVIIRVLDTDNEKILIIDCNGWTMPKWVEADFLKEYSEITEERLLAEKHKKLADMESIGAEEKKLIYKRFAMIASIFSFVGDKAMRNKMIKRAAEQNHVSKQTIKNYLVLFLIYQDVAILAKKQSEEKELTEDEKNMRWGLNKFYYTKEKNSLNTAYILMLKEKYCDSEKKLLPKHPSFNQFRYFYRKHRKEQTYYIARNGIKDYQKNHRPLLGDGVQEFANCIGTGLLDATICDIYLVNEGGYLIGRPILTACIDAFSGLCCGFSLSWEGGVYSIKGLLSNVIADKVAYCKKYGIAIKREQWNCDRLPVLLITDKGSEYISYNFEQITELGIIVEDLPSYRPELKGYVEKFFDVVQEYFKKHLKGKGVIEPDFQERGARDYRKDACLTMTEFEKIVLHCVIYYNSKRIINDFPYSERMIEENVKPYASDIWNWSIKQAGNNLVKVTNEQLNFVLLPRTTGTFNRNGLRVNKMRYKNTDYMERYLKGGDVIVAYNPDDVSNVWIIEDGSYICFELIESRFKGLDLEKVQSIRHKQKGLESGEIEGNLQAQIDLAEHIQTIAQSKGKVEDVKIKEIRKTRQQEKEKTHIDFINQKESVKNNA